MKIPTTARKLSRWMAFLGLICGILYSVGGFVYDLMTIGLNTGTALAFMALIGMPVLFGALGFIAGVLVAPLEALARSFRDRPGPPSPPLGGDDRP